MATFKATSRKETILSRNEIEALIADGRKIVIVDNKVLKTDAWLPYHPGGDKAILHMVGRDATNEVRAFHSAETQALMQKYQIGRIEGQWRDFVPPIQYGAFRTREQQAEGRCEMERQQIEDHADSSENDTAEAPSPLFDPAGRPESHLRKRRGSNGAASESSATSFSDLELEDSPTQKDNFHGDDRTEQELKRDLELYPSLDQTTQADIISKYRQLDARLRDAGLYECNYSAYFIESLRYTALGLTSYLLLQNGYYLLSAAFLGAMWHQLVFTVHDAGHMGITHNFHIDSCIGIFIANFLGGLSCCWWKRNHNVHHIVTNSAEHDPDIQHMPFFAISHRFFSSLKSTYYDRVMTYDPVAKFMLKYQHLMYYPLLTFGRFNLYVLSWTYIFGLQGPRKGPAWWHRYLEIAGQLFFWYWYAYLTVYQSIPSGWSRFGFVMISNMIAMPVHVQITLSHFAMSHR